MNTPPPSCLLVVAGAVLSACSSPRAPAAPSARSPAPSSASATQRWSAAAANAWYAKQPWLLGSDYVPANAVNQLEMWQASTFDPARIDTELGWAESLGMNTMRVFLHDLLWQEDAAGFTKRIDTFLAIAARHHVRPMLVLFDSVWDPRPRLGKQPDPTPGVHNSRWVQSPDARGLTDPSELPRLEAYVEGVVRAFAGDARVLAWDVWNEPDNENEGNAAITPFEPRDKVERVRALLPKVFAWVRAAGPTQPLTSGVWHGKWSSDGELSEVEKDQIELSDVLSFHNYDPAPEFEERVTWLERYGRPIVCTEYLARGRGSTFEAILPVAKRHHVGAINWGFVEGKTQTFLPWDSWKHPYVDRQPPVWHHDVVRADGRPYSAAEADLLRATSAR